MPILRADLFVAGPREATVLEDAILLYIGRRESDTDGRVKVDDWIVQMRDDIREVAQTGRRAALTELDEHKRTCEQGPMFASETLSTTEVAASLRISCRAVQRLHERGSLPAVRVGRTLKFDPLDVAELAKARESA